MVVMKKTDLLFFKKQEIHMYVVRIIILLFAKNDQLFSSVS